MKTRKLSCFCNFCVKASTPCTPANDKQYTSESTASDTVNVITASPNQNCVNSNIVGEWKEPTLLKHFKEKRTKAGVKQEKPF